MKEYKDIARESSFPAKAITQEAKNKNPVYQDPNLLRKLQLCDPANHKTKH